MPRTQRNLAILILLTLAFLLSCDVKKGAAGAGKRHPEYGIEFTRELVKRKATEVFPEEDISRIMGLLDQYGVKPHEQERERVQLAILKLSGGEMEKLEKEVKVAKRDYRDVLFYAEYPFSAGAPIPRKDTKEAKELQEKNKKQYLDWLNGKP